MSKRSRPTLTFTEAPMLAAKTRQAVAAAPASGEDAASDREMLSARINGVNARQFRAYAKLHGTKVQVLLDQAVAEFLERHRV